MWPEHSPLKIWTRRVGERALERATTVVQALARIGRSPGTIEALVCDPEGTDLTDICAFVQVAEELGAPRESLTVTTQHPSVAWLKELIDLGLGNLRFRPGDENGVLDAPADTVAASLGLFCPALHVSQSRGVVLSVCGEHSDHLVLSARQVIHQCTRSYRNCPYRQGAGAHASQDL